MQRSDYVYGTHLPVLLEYILKTEGPILEIGSGMFSTPFLDMFADHRSIVTVEEAERWTPLPQDQKHRWVKTLDEAKAIHDTYDVILFDGPVPRMLQSIVGHGKFVVVHDANDPQYEYAWHLFKYSKLYDRLWPTTMVLSNEVDLEVVR